MVKIRTLSFYRNTLFFLCLTIACLFPLSTSSQTVTPDTLLDYCEKQIDELLKAYPNQPESYAAVGYMHYRTKKYEDAIQAFQKSLELNPNQPLIVQMVAFLYNSINQYEDAVAWYEKTLKLEPDAPRANERLGLALQKLNRMEEATTAFENELKYHPKDASTRVYLGERYFAAGRLSEAEKQAKLAMELEPLLPEPFYLLAKIYRKQGKTEEATELLKKFRVKKDEEQEFIEEKLVDRTDEELAEQTAAQTHYDIAMIFYNNKMVDKAEHHFLRTIALAPKNVEARYNLAVIYQENKQLDKAASLFLELLAIQPNEPRFLLGLSLIRTVQKKYTEAQSYAEKVLTVEPNNSSAKRTLARILISTNQNPKKAIQLIESVVEKEGTAMDYDLLGWAYYTTGQYAKSLEALRTATVIDPNNPVYQNRLKKLKASLSKQ